MARKGAVEVVDTTPVPDWAAAGLELLTITSDMGGHEWGWLGPDGNLVKVPNTGGQHEAVAGKVCELLGIADSLTMEKMGWIRVDGADVRTSHCPLLGCMTKEQFKFLTKMLAALAEAQKGSDKWEQKREFRSLLAHAHVRDRSDTCPDQGGKLVERTNKAGKKVSVFSWDGWEEEALTG